jgi:hypothetical protein
MTGADFFSPLEGEMSAEPTEVASQGTSIRPSTAATPPGRFAATLPTRGRESADA